MKRDVILKMAASTMMFSTVLTGCSPFGGGSVASVSSKPATVKDGARYAQKAQKAMDKGQIDKAIVFAERSVEGVGDNAETRALLGQAYMAAGRFVSAERSFQDAVELGKRDAQTILSLSLSKLAQGKAESARKLVVDHRRFVPTADYGLALALAGDADTAVEVLESAIRRDDVTSRTRQNLGLAYALAGRWREAKLLASRDLPSASVDNRIMQWAQMARPGAYQTRVASILGVTPVAGDPGQPVGLALRKAEKVQVAAVASPQQDYAREVASFDRKQPVAEVAVAPKAKPKAVKIAAQEKDTKIVPVALPASKVKADKAPKKAVKRVAKGKNVKPAPVKKAAPTVAPVKKVEKAPLIKAAKKPVRVALKNGLWLKKNQPNALQHRLFQLASVVTPVLQKAPLKTQAPTKQAKASGTHLVQLGAFSSAAAAKRAWGILSAKNSDLASFRYASSRINVNGKTLYRLAAMGFGNAQTAKDMCSGIKAKGGSCIVRHVKGVNSVAPVRMASKSAKKLASR